MQNVILNLPGKTAVDFTFDECSRAVTALEGGQVILLPDLSFAIPPEQQFVLSEKTSDGKAKNISYCYKRDRLNGTAFQGQQLQTLQQFMRRYSEYAQNLIATLLPHYASHLQIGRTSFRPVEIKGRASSYKKDDTRLHVDAFVATPVQGLRILRVFCNVHPLAVPRVWNLGEPFAHVAEKFVPKVKRYNPFIAKMLHKMKLTKTLRTAYDHYMLSIHDNMKKSLHYQKNVNKSQFDFQPGSTWIVYTDQVSHAALSGQHLLEQTFYLPVNGMMNPATSPLRVLETMTTRCLI